ncbi:zinc ABC transporter solute-binding protein, partial [Bacillus haikouensis]|uniref:metal ABC transporter substrate-binding protein n=1 Tax=Bacillus haikouensis TaxID=1510468 RepID=UPI00155306E1
MFKRIVGCLSLVTLIVGAAACGNVETNSNEDNNDSMNSNEVLKVSATVYPLQYFAEQIAGDEAVVESILPPGSDPHHYEPTTKEMVKIAESDALIYNGAGLEPFAEQ